VVDRGSIYLLFAPFYRGSTVTTRDVGGQMETIEQVSTMTLVEANGNRVIFHLSIFAGLFCATAVFAIRGRFILAALFSLMATALTVLAAMTIGGMYFPAVLGLILGWVVLGIEAVLNLWRRRVGANPQSALEN
jgi:hypothetical protein